MINSTSKRPSALPTFLPTRMPCENAAEASDEPLVCKDNQWKGYVLAKFSCPSSSNQRAFQESLPIIYKKTQEIFNHSDSYISYCGKPQKFFENAFTLSEVQIELFVRCENEPTDFYQKLGSELGANFPPTSSITTYLIIFSSVNFALIGLYFFVVKPARQFFTRQQNSHDYSLHV
jgi:hypothetical protein